jgi:hypothetical protein
VIEALLSERAPVAGGPPRSADVAIGRALAEALGPRDPSAAPERLARDLRALVEDGGLLLERRLRDAIERAPAAGRDARPDQDGAAIPEALRRDVRVLLAAAGRALARRLPAPPVDGPVEEGAHAATGALGPVADSARTEQEALGEGLVARQIAVARQWLLEGTLDLDVPLLLSGEPVRARLHISVDRRRAKGRAGASRRPFGFDVRIDLPHVGRVLACVQWSGEALVARFFVEGDEVKALVEAAAGSLAAGLHRAGFGTVRTEVAVDAVRVHAPERRAGHLPAGGSIFDARA